MVRKAKGQGGAAVDEAKADDRPMFDFTPVAPITRTDVQRECARVNAVLKAEAMELQLGTKGSLARLEAAKTDASAFSYWAELEFREYVRRQLERTPTATSALLVNGGARLLGLSPVTTKRYMGKLRSEKGPFSGLGDIVTLNPHYVPKEQDDYWRDGGDDGSS